MFLVILSSVLSPKDRTTNKVVFIGIESVPKVTIKNHEISYSFNGVSGDIGSPKIVLIHGAGGQEIDWPMAWRSANDLDR